MSVTIDDRVVTTPAGPRTVLVVTPTEPICVGAQRLAELRSHLELSAVDDQLVAAARPHPRIHGFIMRGTSDDGRGSWRFDRSLPAAEQVELARLVMLGHMPFKRMLFVAGCHDSIYVDWPDHEVGVFSKAAAGLRTHLQQLATRTAIDTLEGKRVRLDRWIVERITFYQSVTVDEVLRDLLPDRIARREQRRSQVDELLASFPVEQLVGGEA